MTYHDVFVSVEKHRRTGIVEFIHGVEIWYLINVYDIDNGKILDLFGNIGEDFVLHHADGVRVSSKSNDDDAVFFRDDGLIDFPAAIEMRKEIRHGSRSE